MKRTQLILVRLIRDIGVFLGHLEHMQDDMLDGDLVSDFRIWVFDISEFDWACAAEVWVAALEFGEHFVGVRISVARLLFADDRRVVCSQDVADF